MQLRHGGSFTTLFAFGGAYLGSVRRFQRDRSRHLPERRQRRRAGHRRLPGGAKLRHRHPRLPPLVRRSGSSSHPAVPSIVKWEWDRGWRPWPGSPASRVATAKAAGRWAGWLVHCPRVRGSHLTTNASASTEQRRSRLLLDAFLVLLVRGKADRRPVVNLVPRPSPRSPPQVYKPTVSSL